MKRTADIAMSFANDKKKRHREMGFFALAAAMVILCVVVWLHIDGIATTNEAMCGIPEHTHSEACYAVEYTCDSAEDPEHVHTDECTAKTLTCDREEHTHDASCYSNPEADVETPQQWAASTQGASLTGDWASDLVAVAQTQIGYAESEQNFQVGEDGERHGYTRYGAWNNNPYGAWDSLLVGFCLEYADLDVKKVPRESGAYAWTAALQRAGAYTPATGYTPEAGDIVFFDEDGNGKADHTAIVSYVNSDLAQMSVIRGDVNNAVVEEDRTIGESTILGYGHVAGMQERAESPDGGVIPIEKLDDADNASSTKQDTDGGSADSDEPKKPVATTTEGGTQQPATEGGTQTEGGGTDPAANNKVEGETSAGATEGGTGTTEGEGAGTTEGDEGESQPVATDTQQQPASETGKEQQTAGAEKKDPAAASDDTSIVDEKEKLEQLEAGAEPALSGDSEQTGEGELPDSDIFAAGAALVASGEPEVDGLDSEANTYSMLRLASRTDIARTPLFLSLGDNAGIVSTYAARGSRSSGGIDFKDNITGITVEYRPDKNTNTWITIDPSKPGTVVSEDGQLKFKIDYNLPSGTLGAGRDTIYYQLPTNIKLMQEEFGFVYDSGNAKVGTYRISEDGLVTITFDEVYVAKNTTNDIEGFINVTCDIKQLNQTDGTTVKLPFDDEHQFGITIEKTETVEADLDVVKEKPTYNEAEGTLEYTVVVKSTQGTTNPITLQDIMNGLEFDGPVTIVRKNAAGNEVSSTTANPTGNTLNWTSGQKMEPGETYTFTYKAKISDTVNGTTTVKNSALVSSKKDNTTLTDFASVDTTVKREMLSKTHKEGSEAGKIAWEVTVNKAKVNIDGWTLTDKVNDEKFTGNIIVKRVDKDGSTVDVFTGAMPENGLVFGTDITGENYDPNGTYVITYETDDELALGQTVMRNTATMTPPGNGNKPGISVTDQGEAHPGLSWEGYNPLKKEGVSSVEQAGEKTALNTWHIAVNASEGGLAGPWTLTDELQGNQWLTKAQIEDILKKAQTAADAAQMSPNTVEIKVYKYENGWTGQEVDNWQNVEDGKYRKFELTFAGTLSKGKSLNFEYTSTADVAGAKGPMQFSNNSSLDNVWANATVEYRPSNPTLTKEDSKAPGNANTSHGYTDNGGVFEWALKVSMPADYQGGDLTLTEQLPAEVELDHFTMVGNGQFDDVELKGFSPIPVEIGGTVVANVVLARPQGTYYQVTIPKELANATDANGKKIAEFKFLVGVKVEGGATWKPNANDSGIQEIVLTNKATITTENKEFSSEATQTQVIKKDVRKDVIDKQHIGSDWTGEFDGNTIPYRVDVNPGAETLLPQQGGNQSGTVTSQTLKFVDTLTIHYPKDGAPFSATLVPHSVKVLEVTGSGDNVTETDITSKYPHTYDVETIDGGWEWVKNYKLEIEIPDATHVAVEYKYKIQGTGGASTTIKNTAGLQGLTTVKQDNEDSTNFQVTESEAGANIRGISVYKVDAENASLYLRDAKFKLYKYDPDSNAATEDGKFVEECDLVTDINGAINYSNIEYNVAYKLVETEAPAGYELNTEPYYFYVYHKDTGKHPKKAPDSIASAGKTYTCNMLLPGEGIRIKDKPNNQEKKTANLTLKKVDSTGSTALEGATFRLWEYRINKNDKGEVTSQGYEPIDEFYTSDQLGQIKLTNLRYNTAYMLEEIKAPAGYVKRTEPIYLCVDKADIDTEKYPAAKPADFVATDFATNDGLGIENQGAENEIKLIKNTTKSANVKVNKVWKDAEGNVITDPEVDSIGVTLKRKMVALEESLRRGLPATELMVYKYNKQDDCLLKTVSLSGKDIEVDDRIKITLNSQGPLSDNDNFVWQYDGLRIINGKFSNERKTYTIDAVVTDRQSYVAINNPGVQISVDVAAEDDTYTENVSKPLNAANNWTASWSNLDLLDSTGQFKYEYYVAEDEKIPYYDAQEPIVETTTDAEGNTAYAVTLTNQKRPDPTEITINKAWTDETGNPIDAPDNIGEVTFDLYRVWSLTRPQDPTLAKAYDVSAIVSYHNNPENVIINDGKPIPENTRVKLSFVNNQAYGSDDGKKVVWPGWNSQTETIPWKSGNQGEQTSYTVERNGAKYTFEKTSATTAVYTYEFTVTEDVNLNIAVSWSRDGMVWQTPEMSTPESPAASLYPAQREYVGEYAVASNDGEWEQKISGLQFSEERDGVPGYFYYFVEEKTPQGFMSVVGEQGLAAGEAFEVTNKKVKTAKLDVEKQWLDATNEDLPESLTVKVKRYRTLEPNQVPVTIDLLNYLPLDNVVYSYRGLAEPGSTLKVAMILPMTYDSNNDGYCWLGDNYKKDAEATKQLGKEYADCAVYSYTYEVGPNGLAVEKKGEVSARVPSERVTITETSPKKTYAAENLDPFFEQDLTLTADEGWKKQTGDLPSYGTGEDGNTYYYHYFIVEDGASNGFVQDYTHTQNNGGITNGTIVLANKKDNTPKTSITVNKKWLDKDKNVIANKTTGEVKVQLHQVRSEGSAVKLDLVNKNDGNKPIGSTTFLSDVEIGDEVAIRLDIGGYGWNFSKNDISGLVVPNDYIFEDIGGRSRITVVGTVNDKTIVFPFALNSNATATFSNVTYEKLSSGASSNGSSASAGTSAASTESVPYGEPVALQWNEDAAKSWTHTWTDLPTVYQDPMTGMKYNCTYYVTEESSPGYKLMAEENNNHEAGIESGTITLTNKEVTTTEVTVKKKWVNNDDPDDGSVKMKLVRYAYAMPESGPVGTKLMVDCIIYNPIPHYEAYMPEIERGDHVRIQMKIRDAATFATAWRNPIVVNGMNNESTGVDGSTQSIWVEGVVDTDPNTPITVEALLVPPSYKIHEGDITWSFKKTDSRPEPNAYLLEVKDLKERVIEKDQDGKWEETIDNLPMTGEVTVDGKKVKVRYIYRVEEVASSDYEQVGDTEYTQGEDGGIVATVTNRMTSLVVEKRWFDANGAAMDGNDPTLPGNIDVTLKRYRTETEVPSNHSFAASEVDPDFNEPKRLEKANGWKLKLDNLTAKETKDDGKTYYYYYYVVEKTPIVGFTLDFGNTNNNDGVQSGTITLANKVDDSEKTKLAVDKKWVNSKGECNAPEGASVQVQLHQIALDGDGVVDLKMNGQKYSRKFLGPWTKAGKLDECSTVMPGVKIGDTIRITINNYCTNWYNFFQPKENPIVDGLRNPTDPKVIRWGNSIWIEGEVAKNAVTLSNVSVQNDFDFANNVTFSVVKRADSSSGNGGLGTSVPYGEPKTLSAANKWHDSWDNLPKTGTIMNDDGSVTNVTYTYEVEEIAAGSYQQVGPAEYNKEHTAATIFNMSTETTEIIVKKAWQDFNGNPTEGSSTGSINVILMQQKYDENHKLLGEKEYYKDSPITTIYGGSGVPWNHTFKDLPLMTMEDDKVYTFKYYVKEVIPSDHPNYDWVGMTDEEGNPLASIQGNVISGDVTGVTSGTITLTNKLKEEPGYVLPATGGTGVVPYWALGGLLVAAGALGIGCRRRFERLGERRSE